MKKILILLLSTFTLASLKAQDFGTDGNEFWVAYMENIDLIFNGQPQFSIFVSAKESGTATLTYPATGLTFSFDYTGNEVTEYILPEGIFYAEGSEEIKNFGLRINTSTTANLFTVHFRRYFTDASVLLSKELLGSEYIVSAVKDVNNSGDSPSSFVLVATEDNTEVEIIPATNTAALRPAGIPFTVTLNAGESYQVQSFGDLTGSKIKSSNGEKLAVFSGAARANLYCDELADNHLYDQLFPISYAAQSFALIPFKGQGGSYFKVLAKEDNTEILLNGSSIATLDAGEFKDLFYDSPKILSADKGFFVTQLNPSQSCNASDLGDPTMLQLHSMDYRIRSMNFESLTSFTGNVNIFTKQFLNLFCASKYVESVKVNGANVLNEFKEFPDNPSYSYAMITLPTGSINLEAPDGVLAYTYGFGRFDAYSYGLGFDKGESVEVSEILPGTKIQLFPNPTLDQVEINTAVPLNQIKLFDQNGRLLLTQQPNAKTSTVNLEFFPAGLYYLKLITGELMVIEKVVKVDY